MEKNNQYHTSILLQESVDLLITNKSGIYIDATFGGGGHSKAILNKLSPDGRLFAFDQDMDAQINCINDPRFKLIPENFKHITAFLKHYEIDHVDGIMADLGVSSFHFDTAQRGFSYRMDGPLDMRMDQRTNKTAATILAQYDAKKFQQIFQNFGEVSNAKTLGNYIVEYRAQHKLETIFDLKHCLQTMIKGEPNKYYAKVFQSLRIEVNEELESLEMLLNQLSPLLKIGGRAVFISFHSIEDRLIKNEFNKQIDYINKEYDLFGNKKIEIQQWQLLTKKPVLPTSDEMKKNSRSKSAKLRAAILLRKKK